MNIKKNKNSRFLIIISYTKLYVILLYYNVIKYKNILYRQINLNKNKIKNKRIRSIDKKGQK